MDPRIGRASGHGQCRSATAMHAERSRRSGGGRASDQLGAPTGRPRTKGSGGRDRRSLHCAHRRPPTLDGVSQAGRRSCDPGKNPRTEGVRLCQCTPRRARLRILRTFGGPTGGHQRWCLPPQNQAAWSVPRSRSGPAVPCVSGSGYAPNRLRSSVLKLPFFKARSAPSFGVEKKSRSEAVSPTVLIF